MIGGLRLDGAAYRRAVLSIVVCSGGYWVGLGQNIGWCVQNVLSELRHRRSESDVENVVKASHVAYRATWSPSGGDSETLKILANWK